MITIHATLVHPSQDPQLQADMLQTITELIRDFPEGRSVQWYTPHLDENIPLLDIVLNQKLSPVQETYLDKQFIITRYVVQEMGTLLPTILTDNQVKVLMHLLKAAPLLVNDVTQNGGVSTYLIGSSISGETLVASFSQNAYQRILQTREEHSDLQVQRIKTIEISNMDKLCAAWIEFRCKYLLPEEPKAE